MNWHAPFRLGPHPRVRVFVEVVNEHLSNWCWAKYDRFRNEVRVYHFGLLWMAIPLNMIEEDPHHILGVLQEHCNQLHSRLTNARIVA